MMTLRSIEEEVGRGHRDTSKRSTLNRSDSDQEDEQLLLQDRATYVPQSKN